MFSAYCKIQENNSSKPEFDCVAIGQHDISETLAFETLVNPVVSIDGQRDDKESLLHHVPDEGGMGEHRARFAFRY